MEEVLLCVEPRSVKAGELIFRQGEKGDALYFVDDGRVDICTNDDSKERRVLAQLKAGDSFGEMALVTGEPRTASAVAVEDSSLLRIDKVHFDELIDRSTSLRKAVERLSSERLLQNVESAGEGRELQRWKEVALANIRNLSRSEELEMLKKHASASAPFAIFMGAMLDGIPESIVIGSSFTSLDSFRFTFLAAVFLSNLPEAIASASAMKQAGFARWKIVGLWGFLVVAGGIAAALGNAYLAHAPVQALTLVGAVAGGGILAMVSSVMMPEAYEDGGPTVGLATIAGFLCAFFFSFV
jgi:zinc transporter ZupT